MFSVIVTNSSTGVASQSAVYEDRGVVEHLAQGAIDAGDRAEIISESDVWDTCSYCGYHNGWYELPGLTPQNARDGYCCAGCGAV